MAKGDRHNTANRKFMKRLEYISGVPYEMIQQVMIAMPVATVECMLEDGSVRTGAGNFILRVPEKVRCTHYGPWIDVIPHSLVMDMLRTDTQGLLSAKHMEMLLEYRKKIDAVRDVAPGAKHLEAYREQLRQERLNGQIQVSDD